ncbi:MAG: exodeoxyribonuclease VII small subunit [Lentisphaeria bacterium]
MNKPRNKSETRDNQDSHLTFEAALERLEKIVSEMESGELPLAESMKRFEEGTKLANFCKQKLGETEKKIEVLMNKEQNAEPEWKAVESDDQENDSSDSQGKLGL